MEELKVVTSDTDLLQVFTWTRDQWGHLGNPLKWEEGGKRSLTLTRCRRMTSPTWKMMGWSSRLFEKMVHQTIWLEWSMILMLEQ